MAPTPKGKTMDDVGAVCFGVVIGFVTYRTLVRKDTAAISDLAAVIAAIGGGIVAERFDANFGFYSIGLLAGFAIFLVLRLTFERPVVNADGTVTQPSVLGDAADANAGPSSARTVREEIKATVLGD